MQVFRPQPSPTALNMQSLSALPGVHGALMFSGVYKHVHFVHVYCVCVCLCCSIEQRILLYNRPVALTPQTHSVCCLYFHVCSYVLPTCVCFPTPCLSEETCARVQCVCVPAECSFARGWADFRPPAFCQTPLASLSSGYDPPDFCCSKC